MIKVNRYIKIFLLLFSFGIAGCSDDVDLLENSSSQSSSRAVGDGVPDNYERVNGVGWGYDSNTYYGDPKGVREQIFNAEKLKALSNAHDGELFVVDEPFNMSTSFLCVGENSTDYSEKLSAQASVGIRIPFAFSLDITARFSQSDMESGNCYFATKRFKHVLNRRILGTENILAAIEQGKDVFTDSFNAYLRKLVNSGGKEESIKEFVRIFGNSYVSQSEIGGRLDYNMSVKKSSSVSEKEVVMSVEAKFLSMFSMSVSQTQRDAVLKTNQNSKVSISAKGGDVRILGKALLRGGECDSMALVNWTKSLNWGNAQMVDCKLRPIWELIQNGEIAAKVKAYVLGTRVEEDDLEFPQPALTRHKFEVPDFDEKNTLVKVAWANGRPLVEFCRELVSAYNPYNKVTMAYPIIDNAPDYSKGIFIGDEDAVYLDGTQLSKVPSSGIVYSEGDIAKAVSLSHLGETYRLVKVGKNIWTRDYLATIKSNEGVDCDQKYGGEYNYKKTDNIILFNKRMTGRMKDYLPANWRLPSSKDVENLKSLFNASDSYLRGGHTGLDLQIVTVYTPLGNEDATELETAYLLSDSPNTLIRFRRLEQVNLVDKQYMAPVRMVRASTFRYN